MGKHYTKYPPRKNNRPTKDGLTKHEERVLADLEILLGRPPRWCDVSTFVRSLDSQYHMELAPLGTFSKAAVSYKATNQQIKELVKLGYIVQDEEGNNIKIRSWAILNVGKEFQPSDTILIKTNDLSEVKDVVILDDGTIEYDETLCWTNANFSDETFVHRPDVASNAFSKKALIVAFRAKSGSEITTHEGLAKVVRGDIILVELGKDGKLWAYVQKPFVFYENYIQLK